MMGQLTSQLRHLTLEYAPCSGDIMLGSESRAPWAPSQSVSARAPALHTLHSPKMKVWQPDSDKSGQVRWCPWLILSTVGWGPG